MEYIEIIKESTSIGNAALKIFGHCNKAKSDYIKDLLLKNGLDQSVFDRNKKANVKYKFVTKTCPVCGNEFETQKGKRKEKTTCSIKCSNSYKPKRTKNPNPTPRGKQKRIKKKIEKICPVCNNSFIGYIKTKTCSKECSHKLQSIKMNEKVANGTHIGWQTRPIASYPEKFFMKVLENNNISYKFNYPVAKSDLGINNASCYFLDFYIELDGRRIDLEIDGKQHLRPERKASDLVRDSLLIENGMEVYRIPWKNPVNDKNKEYINNQIKNLISFFYNENYPYLYCMESGFTKEQLEVKLKALKEVPMEHINMQGARDVKLGIKRIERKLKTLTKNAE